MQRAERAEDDVAVALMRAALAHVYCTATPQTGTED